MCCQIAVIWPCLCPGLILCHLSLAPCFSAHTTPVLPFLPQCLRTCVLFSECFSISSAHKLFSSPIFIYCLDLSLNLKPSENLSLTSLDKVMLPHSPISPLPSQGAHYHYHYHYTRGPLQGDSCKNRASCDWSSYLSLLPYSLLQYLASSYMPVYANKPPSLLA